MRVRAGLGAEYADGLVADLPPVAVRAVQEIPTPPLTDPGDVRAARRRHRSRPGSVAPSAPGHRPGERRTRVRSPTHLVRRRARRRSRSTSARPAAREVGRRHPVAGQEPLHVRRGGVAWRSGVDHGDPAPRPAQHESRAQAGGPAADHHHVIAPVSSMAITSAAQRAPTARLLTTFVAVSGNTWWTGRMETSPAITAVLAEVGPRLKRVRTQRRRDADRTGRRDRDLQEHPVPAGIGPTQAQPRAAPADRPGPSDPARRVGRRTRRSATPESGSSPARRTAASSCP